MHYIIFINSHIIVQYNQLFIKTKISKGRGTLSECSLFERTTRISTLLHVD